MFTTTFIINEKGKKISAVMPIKQYEQMLENLEELEDIKAYDKASARKQEFVPFDMALREPQAVYKTKSTPKRKK